MDVKQYVREERSWGLNEGDCEVGVSLGEGECVFEKGVILRGLVQEQSLKEVRRCEREGSVEQ